MEVTYTKQQQKQKQKQQSKDQDADTMEAFGGYRYRMTGDAETNSVLFPTSLDVENNSHVIEAGVRFYF